MPCIIDSLARNSLDFNVDYETKVLLQCKSQFVYALEKFSGKKSLSNFITKKEKFIEPVELNIGYRQLG